MDIQWLEGKSINFIWWLIYYSSINCLIFNQLITAEKLNGLFIG